MLFTVLFTLVGAVFCRVPLYPSNHPSSTPNHYVCKDGSYAISSNECKRNFPITDQEASTLRNYGHRASNANKAFRNSSWAMSIANRQSLPNSRPSVEQIQTRVFDGCDASTGTLLFFSQLIDVDTQNLCGGAAITPYFLVTAGHCVYEWSKQSPDGARYQIRTNSHTIMRGDYTSWSKITVHEKYVELTNKADAAKDVKEKLRLLNQRRDYDIAIVMTIDSVTNTVSLPSKDVSDGDIGTFAGFGQYTHSTTSSSKFPTTLQTIMLTILDESIDERDNTFFTNNNGGEGDSGSPFVTKDTSGKEFLSGLYLGTVVVDDGTTKAEFLKIKEFKAWISNTVRRMGGGEF